MEDSETARLLPTADIVTSPNVSIPNVSTPNVSLRVVGAVSALIHSFVSGLLFVIGLSVLGAGSETAFEVLVAGSINLFVVFLTNIVTLFPESSLPMFESMGIAMSLIAFFLTTFAMCYLTLNLSLLPPDILGLPSVNLFVATLVAWALSIALQATLHTYIYVLGPYGGSASDGEKASEELPRDSPDTPNVSPNLYRVADVGVNPTSFDPVSAPLGPKVIHIPPLNSTSLPPRNRSELNPHYEQSLPQITISDTDSEPISTRTSMMSNFPTTGWYAANPTHPHVIESISNREIAPWGPLENLNQRGSASTYNPTPEQINLRPATTVSMLFRPIAGNFIREHDNVYFGEPPLSKLPNVHPAMFQHPGFDQFGHPYERVLAENVEHTSEDGFETVNLGQAQAQDAQRFPSFDRSFKFGATFPPQERPGVAEDIEMVSNPDSRDEKSPSAWEKGKAPQRD